MARVTAKIDKPMHGADLAAHLDGLRVDMRKAAETSNSKRPRACATR